MVATPEEIALQVRKSLSDGPYACISLEKLSGGTANFVFRGTLRTAIDGQSIRTIVIKHTPPYVASNPAFKLTETRCEYEETILSALHSFPAASSLDITVKTPHLYQFFKSTNTQIYNDLPASTDLKTYALKHSLTQPQSARIGQALGKWAKAFHIWAQAPEQLALRQSMKDSPMKELKYQINYQTVMTTIPRYPAILEADKETFEAIRSSVRKGLDEEEGALIHGDFWTGNILLPNKPFSASEPLEMYVIDWELSHLSSIAFDLGQMFAELFELTYFKEINAGVWIIEAFMNAYGSVGEDLAFKTSIHVGCHLICWGCRVAGWGSTEQVDQVVEIGRGYMVEGWRKNKAYFDATPLECLFT